MTYNWQVYSLPGIGTWQQEPDAAEAGVAKDSYLNLGHWGPASSAAFIELRCIYERCNEGYGCLNVLVVSPIISTFLEAFNI